MNDGALGNRVWKVIENHFEFTRKESRKVSEELLVREMLLAAVAAGDEQDRLLNWLLAFEGAAAALLLGVFTNLEPLVGSSALRSALVGLSLAGVAGTAAKWVAYRIQEQLRFEDERRRRTGDIESQHWERVKDTLSPKLSRLIEERGEGAVARELPELLREDELDIKRATELAENEYRRTLTWFGRQLTDWLAARVMGPHGSAPWLLRLRHAQQRLVLLQLIFLATLIFLAGLLIVWGTQS